jgi:tetratricopeptide (TPR) repeat protein
VTIRWLVAVWATALSSALMAAGSASITPAPTEPDRMAAKAVAAYELGLEQKQRAWALEAKAAKSEDTVLTEAFLKHAIEAYALAVEHQREALAANPRLAEAANELGYALRRTGHPKEALHAYNYALLLKPDFPEAKEYKAEALLALTDYPATQAIYMDLFRTAPDQAAVLMQALETWRQSLGEKLDGDTRAFADWIAARKTAARITETTGSPSARAW